MSSGLAVRNLCAGYGEQQVLHGISLNVSAGEVVALLGANGAGKTTTLLAIAGAIPSTGTAELFGEPASGRLIDRAGRGLAFLPESRAIVRQLSVAENLELSRCDQELALQISPELEGILDRQAGQLSGGEQQILSLTQAVARSPEIILADELSFGLAPIIVNRMLLLARSCADEGAAVLLVEQFARQVLRVADRGYVLRRGQIVMQGTAAELLDRIDEIEASYLVGEGGQDG